MLGQDAFSYDQYDSEVTYMYPPSSIISDVMKYLLPKVPVCAFLFHLHGKAEGYTTDLINSFDYCLTLGNRNNPCCATPDKSKNTAEKLAHMHDLKYYRPYTEPHSTLLLLRGFESSKCETLAEVLETHLGRNFKLIEASDFSFAKLPSVHLEDLPEKQRQ